MHGISIGGIAACHLSSARSTEILIADRTFSNIYLVASYMLPHGKWVSLFYKFLRCFNQDSNNLISILRSNSCKKRIIIADKSDNVVKEEASLILHYSEHLLKKKFGDSIKLKAQLFCKEECRILEGFASLNKFFIHNDNIGYQKTTNQCNTIASLGQSSKKNVLKEEMIEDVALQSAAFNQVLVDIKAALKPHLFGNLDSEHFSFEKTLNSVKLILVWGIRDNSLKLSNMANAEVSLS